MEIIIKRTLKIYLFIMVFMCILVINGLISSANPDTPTLLFDSIPTGIEIFLKNSVLFIIGILIGMISCGIFPAIVSGTSLVLLFIKLYVLVTAICFPHTAIEIFCMSISISLSFWFKDIKIIKSKIYINYFKFILIGEGLLFIASIIEIYIAYPILLKLTEVF